MNQTRYNYNFISAMLFSKLVCNSLITLFVADLSTLHELSFQSDSKRSLEIHLPTPTLDGGGHMDSSSQTSYGKLKPFCSSEANYCVD